PLTPSHVVRRCGEKIAENRTVQQRNVRQKHLPRESLPAWGPAIALDYDELTRSVPGERSGVTKIGGYQLWSRPNLPCSVLTQLPPSIWLDSLTIQQSLLVGLEVTPKIFRHDLSEISIASNG